VRSPTVTWENPFDRMLMDLAPAFLRGGIIDIHETWMQIACERIAFVENQRDTVITVTGCVDDLSAQPDTL
jgi:hypothetical protein